MDTRLVHSAAPGARVLPATAGPVADEAKPAISFDFPEIVLIP